jgi:hypothetical protein
MQVRGGINQIFKISAHNENHERSVLQISGLKKVMSNHDSIIHIATISLEFKEKEKTWN